MEEKIYQRLLKELKNSSLSERTIREYAKKLSEKVTTEEEITDDMIGLSVVLLNNVAGQLNKDVAEKVKEQKEKLIAEFKQQSESKPSIPQKEGEGTKDDIEARILAIEGKFLEALNKERERQVISEAKEIMRKQFANKDYILTNVLSKVKVEEDEDAERLAARCIPLYDKEYREAYGEGVTPRQSDGDGGSGSAEAAKKMLLAFKEAKAKERK